MGAVTPTVVAALLAVVAASPALSVPATPGTDPAADGTEVSSSAASYEATIAFAWEQLQAQRYHAAAAAYRQAAELEPESELAWLGLQSSQVGLADWSAALDAGGRVLALNPDNVFALRSQGFAHYMLGEYEPARARYEAALTRDPDHAETRLGLGFTLVRLGDGADGRALCEGTRAALGDDVRIAECLASPPDRDLIVSASVFGTFLHYTDPWDTRDLAGLSLSAGLEWPHLLGDLGLGLWAGATLSQATLRYQVDDYRQAAPAVGLYVVGPGWTAGIIGAGVVSTDDSAVNGTAVLQGYGRYQPGVLGGGGALTASLYPVGTVATQLDGTLSWEAASWLRLDLGPELQLVGEAGAVEVLGSAHLRVTATPLEGLALTVSGYGGMRRYAVDDSALSIWTNDERYLGGYRLGVAWTPLDQLTLSGSFRHDFGDEQDDLAHDFQTLGATFGVQANF